MRKHLCIIVVLFLLGCVPAYEAPPEEIKEVPVPEIIPVPARVIPTPAIMVVQTRGDETIRWGYDAEGRLVLLNSSNKTVVLLYDDFLIGIDDGVKPTKFYYDRERLLRAERGALHWIFTYTSKGNLLSMDNGERVVVTHDSKGRLSSVARDGGVSTEFEYDEHNRTKAMYKNKIETSMLYDSEGRLARMDRQDDHLVLGYWRGDLLSSLSGTMYGLKETVNYGPADITLLSNVEQNTFTGEVDARMHAFTTYLFCTRFRKLPVLFDGQSWVLYREYLKGTINDYLKTGFVCDYRL